MKSTYTYRLRDEDGFVITEFDVNFEYEISDDDGTCDPYVDVTSIKCEATQHNMLGMSGWRQLMAFDIADQIQSDVQFCAGLIEDDYTYVGNSAEGRWMERV